MRRRLPLLLLVLACAAAAVAPAHAAARPPRLHVGTVTLHHCKGLSGWCGSIGRALDPAKPHGRRIRIGFRWLPASRRNSRQPALVAVEGGPGYPSIGSTTEYEGTYGPLLRTRNLLLVDNRGTGRSALIACPGLQGYTGSTSSPGFPTQVRDCARRIERRFGKGSTDLFATAYAAADLSAVMRALRLGKVDLYGDSYGTWFAQSFMSRYARQLHSVILDSAYPVRGLDPWYASSGDAFRAGFDAVCARDMACATAAPSGTATARLAQLLVRVRQHPITGPTRGAAGDKLDETVDVHALADMVQDAGSDPIVYRELDASVRAALSGDDAPLLRLTAQSQEWSHGTSSASYFSDGLYFAVSCTDYPQLFDMRVPPDARRGRFGQAAAMAPDAFSPFTPEEWLLLSAYSEPYQACLEWPRPRHSAPPVPAQARPLPASVPLLVIGGDLDSLTPLGDARKLAPTLARNVRLVDLRNTVHVTSEGDTYLFTGAACARRIIRDFVQAPARIKQLDARCADTIPPVHTPGTYPRTLADAPEAIVLSGPDPGDDAKRAVTVAAGALADASIRWAYSSASHGPGLRGGNFDAKLTPTGAAFKLNGVRYVGDATVDGTGTWATGPRSRFHGELTVKRPGAAPVAVTVDWNQRVSTAFATVGGASLVLPAP
jgi:pimeloyl-ACP methyl ester carboxylesterase